MKTLTPSGRAILTTARGTTFEVFGETPHYLACNLPRGNADGPAAALLDLEDMASRGYFLCTTESGPGGFVIFEKRARR